MNNKIFKRTLIVLISFLIILAGCSSKNEKPEESVEDFVVSEVLEVDEDVNQDLIDMGVEVVLDEDGNMPVNSDGEVVAIVDGEEVVIKVEDIKSVTDNDTSTQKDVKDKIVNNSRPKQPVEKPGGADINTKPAERPGNSTGGSTSKPDVGTKPPVEKPKPPVEKPQPPVEKPKPPVEKPQPPVEKPKPPVEKPQPPVEKPKPPVETPKPPVEKPAEDVYTTTCQHFPAPTETLPDGDMYIGEERRVPGRDGKYCNEYKNGVFHKVIEATDPIAHKIYQGRKKPVDVGYKEDVARNIMNLINEHRVKNGLPKYKEDSSLNKYADLRAKELGTDFSHNSKGDYRKHYQYENIAAGTPGIAFSNWVNSPLHNAALLDKFNTKAAVSAYVHTNGQIYLVFINNR